MDDLMPPAWSSQEPGHSYEMQSDHCSVRVAVHEGARVASLRSVASGLEFLMQARTGRQPVVPGLKTPFQAGPCAGIEECLPTVGPCGPETPGGEAPDHGDFWQVPWRVLQSDRSRLVVQAEGFSRPFGLCKEISLHGPVLQVAYTLENHGAVALPFVYACHPLFAVDRGDRIVLPREVDSLELYYSRDERLGIRGQRVDWPRTAQGLVLNVAGGPEDGIADMFYSSRLTQTSPCAIIRETTGEALQVTFSASQLPYLGVWQCYGGWPDNGAQPLQYAVALEPTTSPCNTLAEAVAAGAARWIEPGECARWEIGFRVLGVDETAGMRVGGAADQVTKQSQAGTR